MNKQSLLLSAVLFLTAPVLLTGCGSGSAGSEPPARSGEQIIPELITCYGSGGRQSDETVQTLLDELTGIDSRQGALWTDIMDFWDYADNDMEICYDRLPDDLPQDDTLVLTVLGYQLNPDGTMQDELIARLKVALACAKQYPNAYVLCTGGGTAAGKPDATEGGMMGRWLLSHGVKESRLIIEDRSRSTVENAVNSYEILRKDHPQADSVVMISSGYHISWGALLFETVFLKAASEQQAPAVHVVSNCACRIRNSSFPENAILRWETVGMLQMIGRDDLAAQFYYSGL